MASLTEETKEFFDDMLDLQEEIADTLLEIRNLLMNLSKQTEQREKKASHVRRIREKK